MTTVGMGKRIWLRLVIALALAGVLVLASICGMICWKEANPPVPENYDAIVVLGAQVLPDGNPSVQLEWRLQAALEAWQKENCIVITSGAQGGNEPAPEGEVMRQWLLDRGVPAESVISETDSRNTRENIRNAAQLLAGYDVQRVLIVTSDYHLPRAMALAEDQGLEATGLGSPCKPDIINWSRNHGREVFGWVKYWVEKYLNVEL